MPSSSARIKHLLLPWLLPIPRISAAFRLPLNGQIDDRLSAEYAARFNNAGAYALLYEKERQPEQDIHSDQQHALEPGCLAVSGNGIHDERSALWVTLVQMAKTHSWICRRLASVWSSSSAERAEIATAAPSCAKPRAISQAIPRLPPVIKAVVPDKPLPSASPWQPDPLFWLLLARVVR